MAGTKRIKFGPARLVKPDNPPFAANWQCGPAASQNFMWIGLMAHIPYQPVMRRCKDVM